MENQRLKMSRRGHLLLLSCALLLASCDSAEDDAVTSLVVRGTITLGGGLPASNMFVSVSARTRHGAWTVVPPDHCLESLLCFFTLTDEDGRYELRYSRRETTLWRIGDEVLVQVWSIHIGQCAQEVVELDAQEMEVEVDVEIGC